MRGVALAAICLALAAAGCGNNEAHDYVVGFNAVIADLQEESIGRAEDLPSNNDDAALLATRLGRTYWSAAERLTALDPPDEVVELNDLLVAELRGIARRLRRVADAFASGAPERIAAVADDQEAISTARNRFNRQVDEINRRLHD